MKHLKLFVALFAMLALGVTNAYGETVEFDLTTKSQITTQSENSVVFTNGEATLTITKSSSGTAVNNYMPGGSTDASHTRVYKTNPITFDVGTGNKIQSITVKVTSSSGSINQITNGTWNPEVNASGDSSPITYTLNSASQTASVTPAGTSRIEKVTLTYTSETGGGSTEPVLSVTPTEVDFGTVYQGATVADKTVAVNFANLTGAVTYSGLSTPFTATGAISATGDKITISADASTIGEYSQTLTVASTADSKTAEVTVKMNVVEKPAPTGTFTLHTGELIEGDYVIVSTNSLKAEVNSDRLASLPVTISNDEIVDPDATTIWHIAKSGEYWTLYNANKAKYAASTGAKNKAALLDDGSDDKALWSASGTSTYEFVNKENTEAAVNANLRYNSQNAENSRWACYSTGTGTALSLYRKAGAKYNVTVNSTTNGTVTADPTSAEAGATIALTVTPDAGYILDALTVTDASSNTIEVADNKFTMPASDVTVTATFKLNEKPAATLTLSMNGETEDITGYKQDDKVTLPETIDNDCIKAFVGWSANPACSTEPEYAPGDEYTLTATTQTLYAVYATVNGGAETKAANTLSSNGWTNQSQHQSLQIDENVKAEITGNSLTNSGKYYDSGTNWRLYQNENPNLTISTTIGELKSITFTFTNDKTGTLLYGSTILTSGTAVEVSGTSAIFTVGNSTASVPNGQIRISKIEVVYTSGVSYSNYSTTCSAALTAPTFSLAEDTYTEAQEVTLFAEEGTIYYTLDGTTPDAESTEYTEAIVLDECGTTTIKAIAISGENSSPVTSATYTIKLPLNNDQENPYTEADAIEVYDGGCYDNQEVYVKGVVANAQFYGNSGSYTITLEEGFKFYYFYEAAGDTQFTENYIFAGDTLVACGKLDNYKGTYQLAAGCYLVERKPYSAPKVDISNTPETAYTVAQAIALIDDVTSDLTKQVYVKGEISEVESFNDNYGSITYWIKDEEENTFQCYSGLGLNSEEFESVDDLVVGSQVVVYGTLKKHNSTYEFNYNNYIVSLTLPSYTVTVSVNDAAMGSVQGLAAEGKYEHGATAILTAVANDGYEFINWTVNDEEVSTDAEYTFEVLEDLNLVANFKTVEPEVPTALDNIDSTVAPVKAIVNDQLIIIKNGIQYNAQGQVVK